MQSISFGKVNESNYASTEAYNTLKTNIQFCGKDIKSICITSCTPNEGKTSVSFRLAASFAESGKKVLFIDTDLRKSVLFGRLKIDKKMLGLSQYLSGMNTLEEVIYQTNIDNLNIIIAGPVPPNPLDLLSGELFTRLIETQREKYDYLIIDTSPLGIVIDSINVAQICDGTILLLQANTISYKLAKKVIAQLGKGNCRIIGTILNKVGQKHRGYYGKRYGKYYGKSYGKYYGNYYNDYKLPGI